jgi:hypothetical protein
MRCSMRAMPNRRCSTPVTLAGWIRPRRDRARTLQRRVCHSCTAGVYKAGSRRRGLRSNGTTPGSRSTGCGDLRLARRQEARLKLLRRDHLDDKLKKNQAPVAEHPFLRLAAEFLDAQAALLTHLQAVRRSLRARWLRQGSEALEQLKAQRGLLGFDDMLRRLHLALQQPEALAQLRKRYPAALIDEFQDTDPLQYTVFRALFNKFNKGSGLESLPLAGASGSRQELPPCCFWSATRSRPSTSFRHADLPTYLRARDAADGGLDPATQPALHPELLQALNGLFGRQPKAFLQPGLAYLPVQAGSKPRPALEDTRSRAPPCSCGTSERGARSAAGPRPVLLQATLAQTSRGCLHPAQGDRLDGRAAAPGAYRRAGAQPPPGRLGAGSLAGRRHRGGHARSGQRLVQPRGRRTAAAAAGALRPAAPRSAARAAGQRGLGLDAAQLAALSTEDQAAWAARWQALAPPGARAAAGRPAAPLAAGKRCAPAPAGAAAGRTPPHQLVARHRTAARGAACARAQPGGPAGRAGPPAPRSAAGRGRLAAPGKRCAARGGGHRAPQQGARVPDRLPPLRARGTTRLGTERLVAELARCRGSAGARLRRRATRRRATERPRA